MGDRDAVAVRGEGPRDGEADATIAAGHEHRPAAARCLRAVRHGSDASRSGRPTSATRATGEYVRPMRAIQLTEFGGPETLVVREVADPVPGPGQRVFDVLATGVNYADTHQT